MKGRVLAAGLAALTGQEAIAQACPAPFEPVLTLAYPSRYVAGDTSRSVLDEDAEDRAVAALRPLDDFVQALSQISDDMLAANGTERQVLADCLVSQLSVWAQANALADQQTETAQLGVGSRLAAIALVARLAQRETSDSAGMARVGDWLGERLREQMTFWEVAPEGAARGNLRGWAALAAAATADITRDPVLRGWAAWSTEFVLCTANEDGSLPQEMSRGRLALHYQLHALSALVPTAAILKDAGVPVQDLCDQALHRAARFALNDLASGARSQGITGDVQSYFDGSDKLEGFHIAWIEAYLHLTKDAALDGFASAWRPLRYSKLGGNQTLIWK